MPLRNTAEAYGSFAKFLHWAIVLLILPQYFLVEGAEELPEGSQQAAELIDLHKSLGMLVLILAVVRIAWKIVNRPHPGAHRRRRLAAQGRGGRPRPALPADPAAAAVGLDHVVRGGPPRSACSGWMTFPALVGPSEDLHEVTEEVHEVLFWAMVAVATVHVAAALFHHWVLRDDTLRRMLPFARVADTIGHRIGSLREGSHRHPPNEGSSPDVIAFHCGR